MPLHGNHKCIERSIDCNCPICGEYLFSSPKPVIFMKCGHSIHSHCHGEHLKTSYKCPICNKSCVNMESQFRSYDMAISSQPMPALYRDARAIILCNDCSAKSQTAYHWLGLKCAICDSYNTAQMQLLNMPTREELRALSVPVQGEGESTAIESLGMVVPEAMTARLFPWLPRAPLNAQPPTPTPQPSSPEAPLTGPAENAPPVNHQLPDDGRVDDSEGEEEEEDMLDFWGRDADPRNVTSAESADGHQDDDDEASSGDDEACEDEADDDDDDDDEDEDDIVLYGHR
jgi:hypothetical protein